MKKILFVVLGLCLLNFGISTTSCHAQADDFSLRNRFGVGIISSAFNFGMGPTVEYWVSENIGVLGFVTALGDFTSYGMRVDYVFSKPFYLGTFPHKFYIGGGYVDVQGPEFSSSASFASGNTYTTKWETEGSGIEVHAGLLHHAKYAHENLFFRSEFIIYAFDLESNYSTNSGYEANFDTDWSSFTIGFGAHYLF